MVGVCGGVFRRRRLARVVGRVLICFCFFDGVVFYGGVGVVEIFCVCGVFVCGDGGV